MSNEPAIEANFQLSFEQRQRTQSIEEWCDEYPDEAAHLIIGYADRLARLEDGIRALADEKQAEAVEWDELGEDDNASEAFEYAQRLYTLLGDN